MKKIEGIVLRSIDYGESNKIITIFSRDLGKFGAVARGAKKPKSRLASVSQPFTYGHFICMIGNSGLATIQQGEVIDTFRGIKEDLFLTSYTAYIAELLDKGTEDRNHNPFLFELLYQTMKAIEEGHDPDILKNIFEIKMLTVLGFHPSLDHCAICGSNHGPFVFSIKEGGILCERCSHHDRFSLKVQQVTLKLLRLFYYFDLNRLGSINVKDKTKKELDLCISAYYDEYSGIYLKTKRFLQQLDKLKE
jgi:DNA repair protein RecO (recombination protein O)